MYPIIVKYGRLEDVMNEGNIIWVREIDDITTKNFPNPKLLQEKVEVELIGSKNFSTAEDAIRELNKMGYRPANIYELLAFGKKYPQILQRKAVMALGSIWHHVSEYGEFKYAVYAVYDLCWYHIRLCNIWINHERITYYLGCLDLLVVKK